MAIVRVNVVLLCIHPVKSNLVFTFLIPPRDPVRKLSGWNRAADHFREREQREVPLFLVFCPLTN